MECIDENFLLLVITEPASDPELVAFLTLWQWGG